METKIRLTSLVSVILAGVLLVIISCSGNQSASPMGQNNQESPQQQTVETPLPASGKIVQDTSKQKSATGPSPVTVQIVFDMGQAAGPGLDVYKGDFKPQEIYVKPGTTVTWQNDEDFLLAKHSVTSKNGLFDKELNKGESFNYTFAAPGTFEYYCKPYPIMTGKVVVQ